jgi:hypothetical protein
LRSAARAIATALTAQPEIYHHFREHTLANGEIADESFRGLLNDWTAKFADWIARVKAPALSF